MKIRRLTPFALCAGAALVAAAQSINPPAIKLVHTADLDVRVPFDGVHVKTVYTDTTLLFFIEIDAGSSSAHHNHADEQTMLIHSGRVRAVVGDNEYELVGGDVLMVPSYVPHQFNARKWETG